MKRKVEDYTFLVEDSELIKSRQYKYDMLNMLGFLVFKYNYYSDYRASHNGFFYVSADDVSKAVGISRNTVTAYSCRFIKDGLIDYCTGKLHQPSQYRLLWDVTELEVHHPEAAQLSAPEQESVQDTETELADEDLCTRIKNKNKNIESSIKNEVPRIGATENEISECDPFERRTKNLERDIWNGVFDSAHLVKVRCQLDGLGESADYFLNEYEHFQATLNKAGDNLH